jgi:NAD(P)H-dependent flavin oxidoreductase YrpB (nitropropane dioxygenase family)
MGGVAVPELAGAVARAGGLGMLCQFDQESSPARMRRALDLADGGAVGMGFFGHWLDHDLASFEHAADVLRVVEVFWTSPARSVVDRAHRCGDALVAWQVASVADARAAEDAGCDFVIAQGMEAGGHVRGTLGRDQLLEAVLAQVAVPVVIAGGIATATDVAAAIAAGASAVRVGTAFVATTESGGHPAYQQALLDAQSADDTVLTTAYGVGWTDAPHRVLASALAAAEALDGDTVGEAGPPNARRPVPRFAPDTPSRDMTGRIEAMALYAGTGVGHVNTLKPAGDLVEQLTSLLT